MSTSIKFQMKNDIPHKIHNVYRQNKVKFFQPSAGITVTQSPINNSLVMVDCAAAAVSTFSCKTLNTRTLSASTNDYIIIFINEHFQHFEFMLLL